MRSPITTVYQLKIALVGITPQIKRQVQVPADIALNELHLVIQVAMGWTDSHLHSFTFGEHSYSISYEEGHLEELQMEDESKLRLSELLTEPKATFEYDYDFGDSWRHRVTLEKILPAALGTKYPLCLAGKRACPPEDCGGVWGYSNLMQVLRNPSDPEYKEMKAWVGRKFDSEVFDVERVNKDLRRLGSWL